MPGHFLRKYESLFTKRISCLLRNLKETSEQQFRE